MEQSLTVVILAAGLGTRMKSKKAKVLHKAGGLTLVENVVQSALTLAPPERIFVVTGHQAEEEEAVLQPYGVGFFRQTEQKGTGHALLMGEAKLRDLPGRLVVLYGDTPLLSENTLRTLLARDRESGAAATVITTLLEDPTGYGRIVLDEAGNIAAIVEQKAATPDQLKINEIKASIKFQLKKVLCLGVAVGNVGMTDKELYVNTQMSVNFLVSLLKKNWQNVRCLYIKSSMGKPVRLY